jgi:hypothetical protein
MGNESAAVALVSLSLSLSSSRLLDVVVDVGIAVVVDVV